MTVDALRVPPQSIDAEQSVLGGLLLDNQRWDAIADRIGVEDFYRREHRLIFRAISALCQENGPADVITVSERLEQTGELEAAGGLAYLGSLANNTPSAANVPAYADIVRERSILRQLLEAAGDISEAAYSPGERSAGEVLDYAEKQVFDISEQRARRRGGYEPISALLSKSVDRIDQLYRTQGSVTGVATGFTDLDEMTSGLQPSDLIIVAGRPSMGKTSLSMNIAENAALGHKIPVAIFSMEMPGTQLAMRMMASLGRINSHRVRTGKLDDEDWPRLTSAVSLLNEAPIFIDDTPALTPMELRARARRIKREHQLGLVIVDYLQLMEAGDSGHENRATEISNITRALKGLAKELDVPLIAMSQLNRSLETRTDKRPVMSDLRECVTGDTLVCLTDGRRLPIAGLAGQTPEVWAMSEYQRLVPALSEKVWKVGKRQVYRVCLASGRELRATAEHRIYAGKGWCRVSELATGDRVAVFARVKESMRASGVTQRGLGAMRGARFTPSRATLASSAAILGDAVLQQWIASDLFWDRVVAVVPDGEEDVYDLTVPGPASWLADGIVSHNSGAIEQDADVILFIYRDEVYNEDSPNKGTAEIIVGKQRNGPIGRVILTFLGEYTKFENYISGALDRNFP